MTSSSFECYLLKDKKIFRSERGLISIENVSKEIAFKDSIDIWHFKKENKGFCG
jgi:hypothetical protein